MMNKMANWVLLIGSLILLLIYLNEAFGAPSVHSAELGGDIEIMLQKGVMVETVSTSFLSGNSASFS